MGYFRQEKVRQYRLFSTAKRYLSKLKNLVRAFSSLRTGKNFIDKTTNKQNKQSKNYTIALHVLKCSDSKIMSPNLDRGLLIVEHFH